MSYGATVPGITRQAPNPALTLAKPKPPVVRASMPMLRSPVVLTAPSVVTDTLPLAERAKTPVLSSRSVVTLLAWMVTVPLAALP